MNQFLHELYHGTYAGVERSGCYDPEHRQKIRRIEELEENILDRLSEEYKQMFIEYSSIRADMDVLTGEYGFEQGFRLGVRLMIEAMEKGEETERAFRRP